LWQPLTDIFQEAQYEGKVDFYEQTTMAVGFEVLTAVVMKSSIFWDITPCSPLKVNPIGEHCIGFKLLTAVVMKSYTLWDITPCSPLKVNP
jgi:hypothetical protein